MDAQPKIGGFGCFKGVLQIPFFLLMQFYKAIFYFNHPGKVIISKTIYDFLIGDPNIILFASTC
jgi:hypothetical protein